MRGYPTSWSWEQDFGESSPAWPPRYSWHRRYQHLQQLRPQPARWGTRSLRHRQEQCAGTHVSGGLLTGSMPHWQVAVRPPGLQRLLTCVVPLLDCRKQLESPLSTLVGQREFLRAARGRTPRVMQRSQWRGSISAVQLDVHRCCCAVVLVVIRRQRGASPAGHGLRIQVYAAAQPSCVVTSL